MKDLGKRLRVAREKAGCNTIEEAAVLARMSSSSLSDYEGERRVPGGLALEQICKRFGVSADWLLGLRTPPQGICQ